MKQKVAMVAKANRNDLRRRDLPMFMHAAAGLCS
jgi:hypothetical protein